MKSKLIIICSLIFAFSLSGKRIYLPQDKEEKVLSVAKDVCSKIAPDYHCEKMTPLIFSFDNKYVYGDTYNKEYCVVKFFKDTTFINNCGVWTYPRHELNVIINIDSFTPVGINKVDIDNAGAGFSFRPNYEQFLKDHPKYRIYPEWPIRNPYEVY